MKVGDVYSTRDGGMAEIKHVLGNGEYATAVIEVRHQHCVLAESGRANSRGGDRYYDLILPPKTVKAQRVIEYEGTPTWVEKQLADLSNICGPNKTYSVGENNTIREISRKFL